MMKILRNYGAILVFLTIAGCAGFSPEVIETMGHADKAQSAVQQVADCGRLAGTPVSYFAHPSGGLGRTAAPIGSFLNVQLHALRAVSPVLKLGRQAKSEGVFAGLVPVRVETGGTYAVLVASRAWTDVGEADPPRTVQPQSFKWITLCGTRFKSGLYTFEAGKVYWVQLWDSPDRELNILIDRLP